MAPDDEVRALLPDVRRVARYWAQRAGRGLADEYRSAALVGLGEAAVRWDPERRAFRPYAVDLMHKRCKDAARHWVVSRAGVLRSVPAFEDLEPASAPFDDTPWLWSQVLAAIATAPVSDKARRAVLLWVELGDQYAVARALNVTASRVSQMVREVTDAIVLAG